MDKVDSETGLTRDEHRQFFTDDQTNDKRHLANRLG